MLQGHELSEPIQYGYLFLAAAIVLMACITGAIYIIQKIKETATTSPDYYQHWKGSTRYEKLEKWGNSHAKKTGQSFFDWENFLIKAKDGSLSDDEIAEGIMLSKFFRTDPTAYLHKDILRHPSSGPMDGILGQLAADFYVNCALECWMDAWKIYHEINKRGNQLMMDKIKKESIRSTWTIGGENKLLKP
jgi:hypothetical protein